MTRGREALFGGGERWGSAIWVDGRGGVRVERHLCERAACPDSGCGVVGRV